MPRPSQQLTTADLTNRFERWSAAAARHKLVTAVALLLALWALESAAAWSFVAKRALAGQPFTDLLVQYYVLAPFTHWFPGQFVFPPEWADLYAGDITNPRVAGTWWVGDPLLGHRNAANVVVTENRWSYRRSNTQGFVITDPGAAAFPRRPPPDVYRIAVFGGSTVEGNGATGSLHALPAELLNVLGEKYEPASTGKASFEVINAGVAGYMSVNELLYYLSEIRDFHPDLVISYNAWNDLQIQNRLLAAHGPDTPRLVTEDTYTFAPIINGYFNWTTSVARAFRLTAADLISSLYGFAILDMPLRLIAKTVATAVPGVLPDPHYSVQSVERYVDNIQLMALAARRDGVEHAWFLQPLVGIGHHPPGKSTAPGELQFDEQEYIDTRPKYVEQRQRFYADTVRTIDQVRAQAGITLPPCMADLSNVFDDNPTHVYSDGGHLNDAGNRIVASRIANELARCGLVRERAR